AFFFFFQAEDGIRDFHVTGVQTCALPIYTGGAIAHATNFDTVAVAGGTINMALASTITKTGTNTLLDVAGAHTGTLTFNGNVTRSEERRVGKECRTRERRSR